MTRRHVPLEGNLNLRDLGGYIGADGRSVRHGCLFRSDELHALTDADLSVIADLGVRVVFDLRNERERGERPSRLPPGVEVHERETPSKRDAAGLSLEQQVVQGLLPPPNDEEFSHTYIDMLTRLVPELRRIVALALDARQRPLLFHCVAGKDRTGMTAAILLGLLGVPDDVILDDYELTTHYSAGRRLEAVASLLDEHGVAHDRVRPLFEARRPVLQIAVDHLHETWGDFDTYAVDQLGLHPDTPTRLRTALLT